LRKAVEHLPVSDKNLSKTVKGPKGVLKTQQVERYQGGSGREVRFELIREPRTEAKSLQQGRCIGLYIRSFD